MITIFTDGGCRNNQSDSNIGGWGAVIECDGITRELYGSSRNTTNNIQELTGVIKALESLDTTHIPVTVYSDSAYVINGITSWVDGWVSRGWIKSDKKPVLNKELWQRLLELKNEQEYITFCKVKGHSDNIGNNLADALVNKAMDELEEMNNG